MHSSPQRLIEFGGQLHNQDSLHRGKPPLHWYSLDRELSEPQRGSSRYKFVLLVN
jgi:hypothetical protein